MMIKPPPSRKVQKLTSKYVRGEVGGARLLEALGSAKEVPRSQGEELTVFLIRKVELLAKALSPCLS